MKISTYVEAKTGVIYLSVVWNRSNRFMVSTGLHSEKKFYGTEVPGSCAKSRRLQVILDHYSGSEKEHLMNIMDAYEDYRSFGHAVNEGLKKVGTVKVVPAFRRSVMPL